MESIRQTPYLLKMPALARGDEGRLLRFVAEAETFGGDHPFSGEFLTQLGRLVPADWIGYCDFVESRGDGSGNNFVRPGDEDAYNDVDWEAVLPVVRAERDGLWQWSSGAMNLSDILTRREIQRSQEYDLVLKPYGIDDWPASSFPSRRPRSLGSSWTAADARSARATVPSSTL